MKSKAVAKMSHYTGPVRVMTVREVSTYLRVHPSTIYRMLKHHQLPGHPALIRQVFRPCLPSEQTGVRSSGSQAGGFR
jgi:DNA-binding MurR/RpiR family transcriptional regulator